MLPIRKLKQIEGRLLTIIDAVIVDQDQKRSVKDLVRDVIGDLYSYADYEESSGSVGQTATNPTK